MNALDSKKAVQKLIVLSGPRQSGERAKATLSGQPRQCGEVANIGYKRPTREEAVAACPSAS